MRKRNYVTVLFFGFLLAALTITLQFFEYKYYIGSLSTSIYTSVVASLFTAVGIWIGVSTLKQRKLNSERTNEINTLKVKELKLNDREYQVLKLIASGFSNQDIADQLFLALPTVKTHTSNLYTKLNVRSRTQATHKARSLNLI